jgi:hypothetical protein
MHSSSCELGDYVPDNDGKCNQIGLQKEVAGNTPKLKKYKKMGTNLVLHASDNKREVASNNNNRIRSNRRDRIDSDTLSSTETDEETITQTQDSISELDSILSGTWYTRNRFGSYLFVFDTDGFKLYYTGTSCNMDTSSLAPCDEGLPCDIDAFPIASSGGNEKEVIDNTPCDFTKLPPGNYTWRVTGALNPYYKEVSYEFCGMKGATSSEILFEIDCDGHCVPLKSSSLEDICNADDENDLDKDYGIDLKTEVANKMGKRGRDYDKGKYMLTRKARYGANKMNNKKEVEDEGRSYRSRRYKQGKRGVTRRRNRGVSLSDSHVLLEGSIHLHGLNTTELTSEDLDLIRNTLEEELFNIVDDGSLLNDTAEMNSWNLTVTQMSGDTSIVSRKLDTHKTYSLEVLFHLIAPSNIFGDDTAEVVRGNLHAYLHHSMDSGLFLARLLSGVQDENNLVAIEAMILNKLTIISDTDMNYITPGKSGVLNINATIIIYGVIIGIISGVGIAIVMYTRSKSTGNINNDNDNNNIIKHVHVMKSLHSSMNTADRNHHINNNDFM